MDFFGKVSKLIKTEKPDEDPQFKIVIEDKNKNRLSLSFEHDPRDDFPLGSDVQVKITVSQTTLTKLVET